VATQAQARLGGELLATLGEGVSASRLTLLRAGSATHALNVDQRFTALSFTQDGRRLRTVLPNSSSLLPPGHYLLFVFDAQGVPSTGKMLRITAS
jgi:hypothetical protein